MFFITFWRHRVQKRENWELTLFYKSRQGQESFSRKLSESLIKKASWKGYWCASTDLWYLCSGLHQFLHQGTDLKLNIESVFVS